MSSIATSSAAARPDEPRVVLAHELDVYGCESCGLVSQGPADRYALACPRCGHALHRRKPRSLERTVAFLIGSIVMYVPANLLPVMSTQSVIGSGDHTILGGIAELWEAGSWELAVIVFVASIAVPLLKIGALTLLACRAHRRSTERQAERSRLYRIVETVGHWSMLDVFVVVLLVGMVRFGAFARVDPEPGLLAFGAVVVLTMLASASFDARLIWPDDKPNHD